MVGAILLGPRKGRFVVDADLHIYEVAHKSNPDVIYQSKQTKAKKLQYLQELRDGDFLGVLLPLQFYIVASAHRKPRPFLASPLGVTVPLLF